MVTQYSLKGAADSLDRLAALDIAGIGTNGQSLYLPGFERVLKEEVFGLGINCGALGGHCQPGATNLHLVRMLGTAPAADLKIAGTADNALIAETALDERHHRAGASVGQESRDVGSHRAHGVRYGCPREGGAVLIRGNNQLVDMIEGEGFKLDKRAD